MVKIRNYKEYFKNMVTRIPDLKDAYIVATEAQLKKKVANIKEYPILLATIPSSDPDSRDEDNTAEKNSCLIFILKKVVDSNRTDDNYIDDMELTQNIMKYIKDFMKDDKTNCKAAYHELMQYLDINSFHQDPEYNYLGHDGWSLSFKFSSIGY